jgi:hypothetical protein
MDALGQAIGSKINGKWKVLLTDSCHSGAITPADDAAFLNKTLLDLNRNLFSLTASRDRERSFESAEWGGGHGIFTYYVVKGLEGLADENSDGIVTADELAEYVRRNVREATGGQQNPTSDRGSFDSNMLLSYLPSGITPGTPPLPSSAPSSSRPTWTASRSSSTARARASSTRVLPSAFPVCPPASSPSAASRWAMNRTAPARRWFTQGRNPRSRSKS